jgi:hypothetical protein
MMVAGYSYDSDYSFDQIGVTDPSDIVTGFSGGFGSIFRGLGYGGNFLATVFDLLFMQVLTDFSSREVLPGVYVLSAFQEKTYNGTRDFSSDPKKDYYMVPFEYYAGLENHSDYGYAYCEVVTSGIYEFNLTVGAGVTLVIWDNDNSFINAVNKIIDFFKEVRPYMESSTEGPGEIPEVLIRKGVELITWFLIHINDIFTGEELFVLNPITWQKLEIKTEPGYSITKTWKVTGGDDWQIDDGDQLIETIPGGPAVLDQWNATAIARKDSYMEWLLTETDDVGILETVFTSFSFDLMQLWVKNFEIHIDVGAIMDMVGSGFEGSTESINPAEIFQGLDIEFYLFTHHLAGSFLYNDTNSDGKLSADYVKVNNTDGDPIFDEMGDPVEVPHSSELSHRLILGTVDEFDFELPNKDGNKISWGLTMNQATLTPVPVGVDLDSYIGARNESLAYIHFGFTFEPIFLDMATTDGGTIPVLHGAVKLDQEFAPWNGDSAPGANNPIAGLDLAIIYVSTVLHFHLKVDTFGADPNEILDPNDDYDNSTHKLKIGNYLSPRIKDKLDFVDIAGPEYRFGAEDSTTYAPASTNILPVMLFETEVDKHETFEGTPGEVETFAADIKLNVSFNVMVYAVCFPMFENGTGIWHDPTFSVFMVFEAKGFWALILLIAGIGLVGVATILIKRRKDMRF